jgi:hypothetical protein
MKNIIGIGNYIKSSNDTGGITISQQLRDKILAACIPTGNNDSPDRERVKDLSGNGNDFILSNFKFTDNQGYGSYPWNFSSFINSNGTYEVILSPGESTWTADNSMEFPSTIVEVSGLVESGELSCLYKGSTTGSSISHMIITTNGRHRLPTSYVNNSIRDSFGFRNDSRSTVKIKIIPEYEGAIVLSTKVSLGSKYGTVTSERKFADIIGDNEKFTIISFIVPMGKALNGGAFWSYVRNTSNHHLLRIKKVNEIWFKPFIFAQEYDYESAPASAKHILVLGDKVDAFTAENTFTSLEDIRGASYYCISGWVDGNRNPSEEINSCAWYGTIITKDCLTEDEIIQLVQYYNLDKNIKPIIYYDIDKQRPSDGELDKLIDYSLNNNDAKVIGVTLPNKDFPGEVVFGRGKYAVLNKELNLLDSTLVLDREYRNTGQFTPVISNSESDYSTDTPFLMEHFSTNEVWSYGQHTNAAINTNRAVTYLSRFIYHNSNYYINTNVGNSTGGSGLCIGGKVNDQINGDMFFHKLLLYSYSMHVDLLKRQLKKLKIENNF